MAARSIKIRERAATLEQLGYMPEEKLATILEIKVVSLRNRHDLPPRHKLGKSPATASKTLRHGWRAERWPCEHLRGVR